MQFIRVISLVTSAFGAHLMLNLWVAPAQAQIIGTIRGITRGPNGEPLPQVAVRVRNLEIDRSIVSDNTGTFLLADLPDGKYTVTASKGSVGSSPEIPVVIVGASTADVDVKLGAGGAAHRNFFRGLIQAYRDDWKSPETSESGAEPPHRGPLPPLSNPPFPFSIWPIGGTVWIGYNNATSYPLTTALQNGPGGEWWKKHNIQIYGWVDVGANVSTSHARPYGNLPAAYAEIPNSVQLDQATLYIERTPDTIQTDHFDWGFRLTNLYGLDYRFTTAMGYFSQQLLNNPKANGTIGNKYGYDPVMAYVDLYFPKVAQGMDVRIGRYISLPDIEAQLAPNNYTFSHSLTYTYDCYTQTGVNATIKLNYHWTTQFGLSAGCEAAPWAPDAKLTGNACLAYTWSQGGNHLYACANSLNDAKYNYNNLSAYYLTWYHKFGASKWHMAWETWYQYMKDTPNVNNPAAASLLITNANGAVCNNPGVLTCFAPEWSTVLYVNRQFSRKDALILRTEYFDDLRGQRTGYRTAYSESLIAWNHWIGSTVVFRPEIRYDHALDTAAYNNGTKKGQLMAAGDVIFFF
jgi:hypothetical protein